MPPQDLATPATSELHVLARRSELGVARKYAEDLAAAFGLDADSRYEFVYAVNEAVTNAIRRGTFVMPEPDAPEVSEGGRGLALMASLVDEVDLHIDPGGTTVRLSKTRPPAAGTARSNGG